MGRLCKGPDDDAAEAGDTRMAMRVMVVHPPGRRHPRAGDTLAADYMANSTRACEDIRRRSSGRLKSAVEPCTGRDGQVTFNGFAPGSPHATDLGSDVVRQHGGTRRGRAKSTARRARPTCIVALTP